MPLRPTCLLLNARIMADNQRRDVKKWLVNIPKGVINVGSVFESHFTGGFVGPAGRIGLLASATTITCVACSPPDNSGQMMLLRSSQPHRLIASFCARFPHR